MQAKGPDDVIERIGFGRAQIRYLFLAHGIWFTESMQVSIGSVYTTYLAPKLGWNHTERAAFASLLFVGILLGSFAGGYVGDTKGRVLPILVCYVLAAVAQCLHICTTLFGVTALLQVVLGFGQGVGMPTSIALVSETSPAAYRPVLQGLRGIIFAFGGMVGAIVAVIDDPAFLNMHWQVDTITSVVPPIILFFLAAAFLYESPLFLEKTGRRQEALKSLEALRRMNGHDESSVDVNYVVPEAETASEEQGKVEKMTLWHQFETIFGQRLFKNTIALSFTALSMNVLLYGHMYAFSLIATGQVGDTKPNGLKTGYQSLVQQVMGFAINILIVPVAAVASRRTMVCMGAIFGIVGMLLFEVTAGIAERTPTETILYYFGQVSPSLSVGCGLLGAYQLSVDLYPVEVASTSAAFVILFGRIGAIVASFIFEAFTHWQSFYTFVAILQGTTLLMAVLLISRPPHPDQRVASGKAADLESTPLLDQK